VISPKNSAMLRPSTPSLFLAALMIALTIAIAAFLAIDVGVTALAFKMTLAAHGDPTAFWLSFWSGLAYSFWVGGVLFLIAGLILWQLEGRLEERWRRFKERAQMNVDAIALANALYAEFPAKPVFLTNSQTAAARFEAEHQAQRERILAPIIADKAVDCPPRAARRIYRRITGASPLVWSAKSPATPLLIFFSEFTAAYEGMMDAARTLDYRLGYHARRFNRSAADDIRSEADRCFFLGKLLGFSDATLCAILAAEDPEEQRALPERHARLKKVAALKEPGERFKAGLETIQQLLASLRDAPRTVPSDYKGFSPAGAPWSIDEKY
jgi:hypothetical protein